jgi:transposase
MARPKIDPALLFFTSLIKAYEGTTIRRSIDKARLTLGATWWDQHGFHYNRFSDYFNERSTTAHLNWAIAEVCAPFLPFLDDLILDGTGISLTARGTYRSEKYPESVVPRYARLTLAMDRKYKVFPVAIVTSSSGVGTGEISQVRHLLRRLKANGWCAKNVIADTLYGVEPVLEAIVDEYGAHPIIPLKRIYTDTRMPSTPLMLRVHTHFLADKEAFYKKYNQRPLIESGISSLKRKWEGSVRSHLPRAIMNEILFKVLCHNIDCLIHAAAEFGLSIEHMVGTPELDPGGWIRSSSRIDLPDL